jgi:hypothetical protein
MAVTINTFSDYVLTGNPVEVTVLTDATGHANHFLNLRVYKVDYEHGSVETLIVEESMPVIAGAATFDISKYLNTDLRNKFTKAEDSVLIIEAGMVMWFVCEAFETYDNDGIEYNLTSKTATKYAFTGGLNPEDYLFYSPYFESIIGTKFLTWQPDNKKVGRTGIERLYFFNKTATSLVLEVKVYFDDDTDQTITAYTLVSNLNRIFEFKVSFDDLNLTTYETGGKTITSYEVKVKNQSGTVISDVRTYLIDEKNYIYNRQFLFSNSFGCFDCIRFTGLAEDIKELDHVVLDRSTGRKDSSYDGVIKANSGLMTIIWADSKAASIYLTEFFIFKQGYEVTQVDLTLGGLLQKYKWDPIIINNKSIQTDKNNEFIRSFEIEYYKGAKAFFFSTILGEVEEMDIDFLGDVDGNLIVTYDGDYIQI